MRPLNVVMIVILFALLPVVNIRAQMLHYAAATFSIVENLPDADKALRVQYEQIYPSGLLLGARGGVIWDDWHGTEYYGMFGQIGREWRKDRLFVSPGILVGVEKNCTGAGFYVRIGYSFLAIEAGNVYLYDKGFHRYGSAGITTRIKL